jgi:hypothetical protein
MRALAGLFAFVLQPAGAAANSGSTVSPAFTTTR